MIAKQLLINYFKWCCKIDIYKQIYIRTWSTYGSGLDCLTKKQKALHCRESLKEQIHIGGKREKWIWVRFASILNITLWVCARGLMNRFTSSWTLWHPNPVDVRAEHITGEGQTLKPAKGIVQPFFLHCSSCPTARTKARWWERGECSLRNGRGQTHRHMTDMKQIRRIRDRGGGRLW